MQGSAQVRVTVQVRVHVRVRAIGREWVIVPGLETARESVTAPGLETGRGPASNAKSGSSSGATVGETFDMT